MGNVTGNDDGTLQVDTGGNRILRQFLANGVDAFVEVNLNTLATFAGLAQLFGNQFGRIAVHHLQPDAVAVDLGLDVAVC